jgi:hypothetical protein
MQHLSPLAQIEPSMPTTAAAAIIFIAVTVVGSVLWAMRYVVTTTLPELAKTFSNGIAEERRFFADQTNGLNNSITGLTAAVTVLTRAIADQRELIIAKINEHTTLQMQAYRHDLNDQINKAILSKEAYDAMKRREAESSQIDAESAVRSDAQKTGLPLRNLP